MEDSFPETESPFGGDALYQITGKVVNILAEGPFTSALLPGVAFLDASDAITKLKEEGAWGTVIVFKNDATASAEFLQNFAGYLKYLYGPARFKPNVALVLHPKTEGVEIMRPLYLDCFRSSGLTCNAFENYPEARRWVDEQIENTN